MSEASLMLMGLGLEPGAMVTRSVGNGQRRDLLLVNLEPFAHAATSTEHNGVVVWRAEDGHVVTVGVDLPA